MGSNHENHPSIDVVVVAYNSRDVLRDCVAPLAGIEGIQVIVVNNASPDDSLQTVSDLPIRVLDLGTNGGFAHGCNAGWRAGEGEYVLFLNPDTQTDPNALAALACALDEHEGTAAVAPRIVDTAGVVDFSQRRFPRLVSTYAQALFLHRVFPSASWVDELVREDAAYAEPGSPDWVSGAAILVRRSALEALDGWDQGFFMYGEDIDLCKRIRDAGWDIRFEPGATVVHEGGTSTPRAALLHVLAASRVRYARKHASPRAAALERFGIALGALTHIAVSRGGRDLRAGHVRALVSALRPSIT